MPWSMGDGSADLIGRRGGPLQRAPFSAAVTYDNERRPT